MLRGKQRNLKTWNIQFKNENSLFDNYTLRTSGWQNGIKGTDDDDINYYTYVETIVYFPSATLLCICIDSVYIYRFYYTFNNLIYKCMLCCHDEYTRYISDRYFSIK